MIGREGLEALDGDECNGNADADHPSHPCPQYGPSTSGYVNFLDGVPAAPRSIAAPGNPRVTIPVTGSSPALSTGAGLDEQRRGERGGTGASIAGSALNDPALQEHGRGERADD